MLNTKDADKSRMSSFLSDDEMRKGIPSYLPLSLSKFTFSRIFFCLLPSFCLMKRARRYKNSMCNRNHPCMLSGCKIFPVLDGVRAFTHDSSWFQSLRKSQRISLHCISCAQIFIHCGFSCIHPA